MLGTGEQTMLKRVKAYFAKKKKRKRLYKYINHEILEVLATICLYLKTEARRKTNQTARAFDLQYYTLKELSEILSKDIYEEEK